MAKGEGTPPCGSKARPAAGCRPPQASGFVVESDSWLRGWLWIPVLWLMPLRGFAIAVPDACRDVTVVTGPAAPDSLGFHFQTLLSVRIRFSCGSNPVACVAKLSQRDVHLLFAGTLLYSRERDVDVPRFGFHDLH